MAAFVNKDECIGCGACMGECLTSAIDVVQTASVDPDICVSCGACVFICPVYAITME